MRPALLLALAALGGCETIEELMGGGSSGGGGGQINTPAPPPGGAAAPAKDAKAKAETTAQQPELYVYNPIGKRDPFRTFLARDDDEEGGPPRTPLQTYDIDQYLLVGIIWGIDRPRALVEDPTGEGWVMEIGTYIGKNWGKVTQITSDVVVVTEEYQTMDGRLVVNPIHMRLPAEEQE
jgi:type IV pilus assembly protein PilP